MKYIAGTQTFIAKGLCYKEDFEENNWDNKWIGKAPAGCLQELTFQKHSFQADKLALLAIILLLADVSPIYSSGLPQGRANILNVAVQVG